jgi:hypothetical protein
MNGHPKRLSAGLAMMMMIWQCEVASLYLHPCPREVIAIFAWIYLGGTAPTKLRATTSGARRTRPEGRGDEDGGRSEDVYLKAREKAEMSD